MVHLSIYKSNNCDWERTREMTVNSIHDAVRIGQESGLYFDIFDPKTSRIIDWNEINIKNDDGWYYDEEELIWKKYREEETFS